MKALIVYDSMYGNTEQVAQAVCETLAEGGEAAAVRVGELLPAQWEGVDLLVVGSPTQKFNPTAAISNLLKGFPGDGLKGKAVAAFDTRMTEQEINQTKVLAFFVGIFGYAAKPMAQRMMQKGGRLVVPAEGFLVQGMEGPLVEGELERARAWGTKILAEMG